MIRCGRTAEVWSNPLVLGQVISMCCMLMTLELVKHQAVRLRGVGLYISSATVGPRSLKVAQIGVARSIQSSPHWSPITTTTISWVCRQDFIYKRPNADGNGKNVTFSCKIYREPIRMVLKDNKLSIISLGVCYVEVCGYIYMQRSQYML